MLELWPRDERGYLLLIKYYALVKDRAGIEETLEKIRANNVYLSPSGRNQVEFWTKESENSDRKAAI